MNPYVERLQKVIAFIAAFLFIACLLLSSFEWAVYRDEDYKFYEKEYEKYEVTKELDMEMEDVMYVTEEMMAYLIGEREELSVWTTVEGREQDFFNEQDRFHMGEVRTLFIGGLKLRNGLFLVVLGLNLVLIFMKKKNVFIKMMFTAGAVFLGICAVVGIACAMNFTKVFYLFHQIVFDNEEWLFDPAVDYMIRMLPEGFFFDMLVRIGTMFGLWLIALMGASLVYRILEKNQNKQFL